MAATGNRRVCVAQIGAPHGVRGEVRLKPFTTDPAAVAQYGPLETEDGTRRFEILAMRPAQDILVVRLTGVYTRNAAEALRNQRLYVARDRLAPTDEDEDEFYHADLIGLDARSVEGKPLGTVTAVLNFGAGDILEIAPTGGGPSVLIPFSKAAVPDIDLQQGVIVIDPPLGTFEPGPSEAQKKAHDK
jgi:16S rRNA processing protein RimM